MRFKFLFLFTLLISTTALSAVFPNGPALTAGGQTFVTPSVSAPIYLNCNSSGTANGCTFRKWGATSGYAVTGGKTFYVDYLQVINVISTAPTIILLQSDNDLGFGTASTSPTNPIYFLGNASGDGFIGANTVAGSFSVNTGFPVNAGKYLSMLPPGSGANADFLVIGHEQ
jgi:hypothetical protein